MPDVLIRPACRSDAADLAMLDNIGSHGLALWFWQGAVMMGKADDALDWGRQRMMDDDAPFGWRNAAVAEEDGLILGSVTSYLMPDVADDEKSSDAVMAPLMELFAKAAGDWMIDNLSVFQTARGKGVGATLLDHAFGLARDAGTGRVSLVAADNNSPALALYHSRGFAQRDCRATVPWSRHVETKNWLLMTAELN